MLINEIEQNRKEKIGTNLNPIGMARPVISYVFFTQKVMKNAGSCGYYLHFI
jgi:hypothetical protein